MPQLTITIPNEGHTLASMLRHELFDQGADFAACVVPHPQGEDLVVTVHHEADCKACIVDSLHAVRNRLEKELRSIQAYRCHRDMVMAGC